MLQIKDFPEDLHTRLKVLAAMQRRTLKDLVAEALADYCDKAEGKGARK